MNFEAYRLGNVRGSLDETEPALRDANLLNFSLNALKYSDSPASVNSNPNGLTGDEACQLSFFAGHSNRLTAFGIYDLNPDLETSPVSAKLSAQIIWYLLEGFSYRIIEEPDINPENFKNYIIHNSKTNQNISFYKSNLTNRWWMEIVNEKTKNNILISCSENDYLLASRQEIPERWWRVCLRQNKVI
jgi:formiminoglutamase